MLNSNDMSDFTCQCTETMIATCTSSFASAYLCTAVVAIAVVLAHMCTCDWSEDSIARPLVPLPTGRGRGRIGSVRLGSVQSASGGLKRTGNSGSLYHQVLLRVCNGRSAGVSAITPKALLACDPPHRESKGRRERSPSAPSGLRHYMAALINGIT